MNNSVPLLKLLDKNDFTVRPTVGISMEPLLHEDSTLVVIVKKFSQLKRGDIVLFQRENGAFVLHRIVKIKNDCFYIRGDNCNYYDKVAESQIKGLVVQIYRNGKFFYVDKNFFYRIYMHYIMFSFWLKDTIELIRSIIGSAMRRFKRLVRGSDNES